MISNDILIKKYEHISKLCIDINKNCIELINNLNLKINNAIINRCNNIHISDNKIYLLLNITKTDNINGVYHSVSAIESTKFNDNYEQINEITKLLKFMISILETIKSELVLKYKNKNIISIKRQISKVGELRFCSDGVEIYLGSMHYVSIIVKHNEWKLYDKT